MVDWQPEKSFFNKPFWVANGQVLIPRNSAIFFTDEIIWQPISTTSALTLVYTHPTFSKSVIVWVAVSILSRVNLISDEPGAKINAQYTTERRFYYAEAAASDLEHCWRCVRLPEKNSARTHRELATQSSFCALKARSIHREWTELTWTARLHF